MDPERGQLESRSAGTGFETPGQQCLPNWEMGQTTVDGCLLAGVSSNLGGNVFPLEELGIEMQTDSQTPTYLPHQKPFSCRGVTNLETASQLAKRTSRSTPGRKEGSHRFEKRMYWYSFLFMGGV